jgi:quercetin dioxygenase-like cupin family protein
MSNQYRWADIPGEQMNDSIARQYVTGDRITIARLEMKRGGIVPEHVHENEQISYVITGALKFTIEGREIIVKSGGLLQIPGQVPHAVEILEDSVTIDVFSPIRQDWIDKTDTYFKKST